jgi:hypothetical protein
LLLKNESGSTTTTGAEPARAGGWGPSTQLSDELGPPATPPSEIH